MTIDWQTVVALAVVALAAAEVVRRVAGTLRARRAGCGACGACPSGAERQLIELQAPKPPDGEGRRG